MGRRSFYHRLPDAVRMAVTFLIVLVGWVFFRADDLPAALRYLGNMFGLGAVQAGADLLAGIVYQPYYLLSLALAAAIAFLGVQSWDFSRRLTAPRALACLGLLLVACSALFSQSFNPFIYFIF